MGTKPSPWQEQQVLLLSELSLYLPPLFVPLFFYFKFLYCIESLPTWMFVYHLYDRYLQRLEKGIISLELEFLDDIMYAVNQI